MSPARSLVLATPCLLAADCHRAGRGLAAPAQHLPAGRCHQQREPGPAEPDRCRDHGSLRIGIYTALVEHFALWRNDAFWTSLLGWLLALLLYDFCYYWLHRMGHESAVLWAAHAVHHQSQDYNLSTALRQTSSGALLGWVFYVPMALAGVPPLVFGVVALIDLLYQFWVHTEQVGKLWLVRPVVLQPEQPPRAPRGERCVSGQELRGHPDPVGSTLWHLQRRDDHEKCVYGTRGLLNSWDPLWANAQVYAGLAHDSWHARRWADKLRVWIKPPGWRPADVAERFPNPPSACDRPADLSAADVTCGAMVCALQFALLLRGWALFYGTSKPPRAQGRLVCPVCWWGNGLWPP